MRHIFFAFLLLSLSPSIFASQTANGRVNVSGQIVEAACGIDTDDVWQEIGFGTIPLSQLSEGKTPISKPLRVHLINCTLDKADGGKWNGVSITFSGRVTEDRYDIFAMSGDGSGVGINITDMLGNKAISGQALPSVPLQENNTELNFIINFVRNNDNLVVGDISSFIRFMISYQ